MVNYFRINDPSRLVSIAILMLLIRIPYFIWGDPMSEDMLRLMLLGEKVASGNWLYLEIYTYEPVFSGLFFGLVHLIFGQSPVIYQVLGYLLAVVQVLLVNKLVSDNRATLVQSFFPGLVYGILLSLFPEAYSVSPALIATTFILIALNYQFNHLEFKVKRDEKILSIGLFLSFASLFLSSGTLFIITALVIFILFTSTVPRRYLLLIFGFALPYLLIGGIYILKGSQFQFMNSLTSGFDSSFSIEPWVGYMAAIPLFAFVRSLPFALLSRRFTNYQTTLNQSLLIWLISGAIAIWISPSFTVQMLVLIVPVFSIFIAHLLVSMKSKFLGFSFYILFLGVIVSSVLEWKRPDFILPYFGERSELKTTGTSHTKKSMLVLGDEFSHYKLARHATPFFDWSVSEKYFTDQPTYHTLRVIRNGFISDPPEIVVDPQSRFKHSLEKIPELADSYRQDYQGNWIRTANN